MRTSIYCLSLLISIYSNIYAQTDAWTVSYHHDYQDTIFTISQCRLLSVTSDSLKFRTDKSNYSISLYWLTELSQPNTRGFNFISILIGSAIGFVTSFTYFQLKPIHPDQVASKDKTISLFTFLGGVLGLIRSIDAETVRYHFPPATILNQEKRKIIETILDEEKNIQ
jgi:hypothetical protein